MTDRLPLASKVLRREGAQSRLLVLLHGYGQPTRELTDRLDLVDPTGRFLVVVPEAPFERRGRAIWHRALLDRSESEAQLLASMAALDGLLGDLEARLGLPASEAVVGGFSQGGGLALGLLLGAEVVHRPAAGFGVCSFPPMVQGFRVDRAAAAGRPYLLWSVREDRYAPIEVSRACAELVRENGLALTYVEADGGHEMTDEAAATIGGWLNDLAQGRPPPPSDPLPGPVADHAPYDGLWEHVT